DVGGLVGVGGDADLAVDVGGDQQSIAGTFDFALFNHRVAEKGDGGGLRARGGLVIRVEPDDGGSGRQAGAVHRDGDRGSVELDDVGGADRCGRRGGGVEQELLAGGLGLTGRGGDACDQQDGDDYTNTAAALLHPSTPSSRRFGGGGRR